MKLKRGAAKVEKFSPPNNARTLRACPVDEAEPTGWMRVQIDPENNYHLFCEPTTKQLACTCADFVYRGNAEPGYECKHVSAVLKYIARQYLAHEYVTPGHKAA